MNSLPTRRGAYGFDAHYAPLFMALFGALLLAYYDDAERLTFAGRVGTGMSDAELCRLHETLQPHRISTMPLDTLLISGGGDITMRSVTTSGSQYYAVSNGAGTIALNGDLIAGIVLGRLHLRIDQHRQGVIERSTADDQGKQGRQKLVHGRTRVWIAGAPFGTAQPAARVTAPAPDWICTPSDNPTPGTRDSCEAVLLL